MSDSGPSVVAAAAESAEPERAVAGAIHSVISRVLVFCIGSIFLVVTILPWNDAARMAQLYVSALEARGIPAAAQIMNAVILTAMLFGYVFRRRFGGRVSAGQATAATA